MKRQLLGCWLAVGMCGFVGCSNSGEPKPTPAAGVPKLTAPQIDEMRQRYESILSHESGAKPGTLLGMPPLPVLELRLEGPSQTAADALGRIGKSAVPALIKALGDKDARVRARAAQALARIGPDAAPAVPELTKSLDDADPDVRRYSARALGQIGPASEPAIPELVMMLEQPDTTEEGVEVPLPQEVIPLPSTSPSDKP